MIVKIKMMKPQNVTKCASPGTVHFSSFRCPNTSLACTSASRAGCLRVNTSRSGAGCPARPSRPSHQNRRPAITTAATVSTRPTTILRTTGDLLLQRRLPAYAAGFRPFSYTSYTAPGATFPSGSPGRSLAAFQHPTDR